MTRRTALIFAFALLAAGGGVWLFCDSPQKRTTSLRSRLLGSWTGTGKVAVPFDFDIGAVKGGPTAKWAGTNTAACRFQVEFRADGTYAWQEEHQEEGANEGVKFWFQIPKEGEDSPRWEVVSAEENKLIKRIHLGDAAFDFQDKNAFTLDLPESAK